MKGKDAEERAKFDAQLAGEQPASAGVDVESLDELGALVRRAAASDEPLADDRGLGAEMDRLLAMRKNMGLPDLPGSTGPGLPSA